jgi:hypothetical protein
VNVPGCLWRYRLFNQLAIAFLTAALIAVGLLYFWLFDRRSVIEVHRVEASKPVYVEGEPIVMHWDLELRRRCDGEITRYIFSVDRTSWPLEMPVSAEFDLGRHRLEVPFQLPPDLTPGRFEYRVVAAWRCNPMSSRRQVLASVPFTVAPAEAQPPDGL